MVGCDYLKFKLTPVNWNFRYNNTIIMACKRILIQNYGI